MNKGIDELLDTVISIGLGQVINYNNIVINRVGYRMWSLSLTDGPITVRRRLW